MSVRFAKKTKKGDVLAVGQSVSVDSGEAIADDGAEELPSVAEQAYESVSSDESDAEAADDTSEIKGKAHSPGNAKVAIPPTVMEISSGASTSGSTASATSALGPLEELLSSGALPPGALAEFSAWAAAKAAAQGAGKPTARSKPKVPFRQPPAFSGGDGEDFYSWKDQLLTVQVLHGYDDGEFAPVVAYALAGAATKWMSVQPASVTRSAAALLDGLERRYGLPTVEALARRVRACRQEKGERASDFWLRIGKEAARLGDKAESLVDKNELWRSGLRQDLRNYVDLFPLVEYDALRDQLDRYESNKIAQLATPVVAAVPAGPSVAEQLAALTEAVAQLAAERRAPTGRPPMTCWHCRQLGHRRAECPQLRGPASTGSGGAGDPAKQSSGAAARAQWDAAVAGAEGGVPGAVRAAWGSTTAQDRSRSN